MNSAALLDCLVINTYWFHAVLSNIKGGCRQLLTQMQTHLLCKMTDDSFLDCLIIHTAPWVAASAVLCRWLELAAARLLQDLQYAARRLGWLLLQ